MRFDVNVDLYDARNPERVPSRSVRDAATNLDNYIDVVDAERARQLASSGVRPHQDGFRSHTVGGDEGEWRGFDHGRVSIMSTSDASHEFGHLLGFRDRYMNQTATENGRPVNRTVPRPGWEGNMMAEPAGGGRVTQQMIDVLVHPSVFVKEARRENSYRSTIDASTPVDYQ